MPSSTRTFSSTPDAAAEACEHVEGLAELWGLAEELRDRAVLAAGEVVDNAAGHGHGYEPSRQVTLTFSLEDGATRMVVEQERSGLSQEDLDEASLPHDPLDTRGRGLFIIQALADRVTVEEGGRRLVLTWGGG